MYNTYLYFFIINISFIVHCLYVSMIVRIIKSQSFQVNVPALDFEWLDVCIQHFDNDENSSSGYFLNRI